MVLWSFDHWRESQSKWREGRIKVLAFGSKQKAHYFFLSSYEHDIITGTSFYSRRICFASHQSSILHIFKNGMNILCEAICTVL